MDKEELLKKDIESIWDFIDKCRSGSYRIRQEYFWAIKNVVISLEKELKRGR